MSDHLQSLKRFKSATSSSENTESSTIAAIDLELCMYVLYIFEFKHGTFLRVI